MNAQSLFNPARPPVWDSFRDLNTFENRLEKFLAGPLITGNGGNKEAMPLTKWAPLVDITEDDKEYIVTAELPEGVTRDKVAADFKDGVLKIHLPKDEKAKPKAIEVKVQ